MSQEFDLIDVYFKPLSQPLGLGDLGIGDDGAVLTVPAHNQLVVVTDTLVAGVHFAEFASGYDIGWKSLAVNLSDLAAMGAKAGFYSLALTLPHVDQAWLSEFALGLKALAHNHNIPLIGGDTTKGPLTITVTAQGWVPNGQAVLRSGAQAGDLVCVTGVLGEGALGLKLALQTLNKTLLAALSQSEQTAALAALNRPQPQLALGANLHGLASAAIDVSDGLLADFGHILNASSKAQNSALEASINLDQLPISSAMQTYIAHTNDWSLVLSGGDDYQLCLSVPPQHWDEITAKAQALGVRLTVIGKINQATKTTQTIKAEDAQSTQSAKITMLKDQKPYELTDKKTGFSHF